MAQQVKDTGFAATVAQVWSLAQEFTHAMIVTKKGKKKKKSNVNRPILRLLDSNAIFRRITGNIPYD